MKKFLDYIYCGEVDIQKSEVKDFKQAVRCLEVHPNLFDADIDQILKDINQPIKLKWSNRGKTFAESFKELYRLQEDCDATLVIGNIEFKAHRVALSACSAFFKRLFNKGLACEYELKHQCTCNLQFIQCIFIFHSDFR